MAVGVQKEEGGGERKREKWRYRRQDKPNETAKVKSEIYEAALYHFHIKGAKR